MRISDWISYVCSSDLFALEATQRTAVDRKLEHPLLAGAVLAHAPDLAAAPTADPLDQRPGRPQRRMIAGFQREPRRHLGRQQIGRASCRERGCQYEEISVVAVSLKQKQHTKTQKEHYLKQTINTTAHIQPL